MTGHQGLHILFTYKRFELLTPASPETTVTFYGLPSYPRAALHNPVPLTFCQHRFSVNSTLLPQSSFKNLLAVGPVDVF
jgi:hypothetical protein